MKEVKVVIGKNFGDEGKGAMVHRLCAGKRAIVVRHNGGAQAGHTVEEGDFRFVFHQLGSGSLAGCPTFWSKTFLPDLLKLDEEVEGFLAESGHLTSGQIRSEDFPENRSKQEGSIMCRPEIYAHPDCACTIIYDVLFNSLVETLRGSAKHGSCGMGIYEATMRVKEEAYTFRLKEFAVGNVPDIVEKMRRIRQEYTLPRLQKLREEYGGAFDSPQVMQWIELIEDDNVLWNVAEQMWENFHKYVVLQDWQWVKDSYDTIVFENAQGLMLDRDNEEYYPHLTPSHTGLYNVAELLTEKEKDSVWTEDGTDNLMSDSSLEIYYVTRAYVTRHGMGRLDYECSKEAINPHMMDKTNVPNCWQDELRYAKHPSGEAFWKYLRKDLLHLEKIKGFRKRKTVIYVNHLDETQGNILFADGAMDLEEFANACEKQGIAMMHQ